jgi:uncharacterized membrane protein YphA (DoxX/SURF4 family)
MMGETDTLFHAYAPAFARLLLAAVFLYSAQDKLRNWTSSLIEVTELGLPFPPLFVAATIGTQLIGGLSVALDLLAPIGAGMLAAFTIAATVLGHRFWLLHGEEARKEFTTALEHLAIVGGLLLVVARQI